MLLGSHAVVACAILVLASMLLLAFLLLLMLTFLLFYKILAVAGDPTVAILPALFVVLKVQTF